jgi:acyl carrier protein
MDNRERVRERILAIVRKVSHQTTTPDPDESLFDSGFLDSFALPDMVSELEREFGLKIPDSDLHPRKFESIVKIQSYIESRM